MYDSTYRVNSDSVTCTVTQPTRVVATDAHSNVLCYGGNTGSVTVTFSGGTAPYTLSFNGGAFVAATSPKVFSNLAAGTYTWTVKDANGCTVDGSETVEQPATALIAGDSHTNVLCYGGNTGSVTITFSGGTAPYSVSFNGGAFVAATSPDVHSNLTAGTYTWTVKDANGCTVDGSETVEQPSQLTAVDSHTNLKCYGQDTASVTIIFGGGTAPYAVSFNGGAFVAATSPDVHSNLTAGTYTWTVKDANGCTVDGSETVEQPSAPLHVFISVTKDTDCDDNICDGSALATVNGGTAAYSFAWRYWTDSSLHYSGGTPIGISSSSVGNLCASYCVGVKVTDANGCMDSTESFDIVGCEPHPCLPLKTYTQGGWGAVPNGNNPGTYLHANFAAAFPSGVTLGCTNKIQWTSAQAITDWLPSGTTAGALPAGTMVNPSNATYNNVLAAQLLAATLNVGFDAYDPAFSPVDASLGARFFADGPFTGMTVNSVIAWANEAIGGCDMHGHTYAEYNEALTNVNENYDNGTVDQGYLNCRANTARFYTSASGTDNVYVFPNPAINEANIVFNGKIGQLATVFVYDLSGRLMMTQKMPTKSGMNQMHLNVSRLANQNYVVKIIAGSVTTTSMITVQH